MPWTSHRSRKPAPAREFIGSQLPNAKPLCQEANRVLRAGRRGGPPVEPVPGADSALIGVAIEFALAAAAGYGRQARIVGASTSELADRSVDALQLALNELQRLIARRLTTPTVMRAADCALVCAWFERRSKMPPDVAARYDQRGPADGVGEGLDGVIRALRAGDATRRDLTALIRASIEDTSDLYRAQHLYMNPIFALSPALGGGEADLIADGLLVDFKASRDRSVIGSREIPARWLCPRGQHGYLLDLFGRHPRTALANAMVDRCAGVL